MMKKPTKLAHSSEIGSFQRYVDCVLNMRVAMQREGPDASVMVEVLTAMYFEACDVVLEQAEKGAKKYRASEQSLEEFGDSAKS